MQKINDIKKINVIIEFLLFEYLLYVLHFIVPAQNELTV